MWRRAGCGERGFDGRVRIIEKLKNLTIVFAEKRGRKAIGNGMGLEANRACDVADDFQRGMFELNDKRARK